MSEEPNTTERRMVMREIVLWKNGERILSYLQTHENILAITSLFKTEAMGEDMDGTLNFDILEDRT